MSDSEVDFVLERFDQTVPDIQRGIVAKLVKDLADAQDEIDTLKAERDEARSQIASLCECARQHEAASTTLKAERDKLQAEVREYESLITRMGAERDELLEIIRRMNNVSEKREAESTALRQEVERLTARILITAVHATTPVYEQLEEVRSSRDAHRTALERIVQAIKGTACECWCLSGINECDACDARALLAGTPEPTIQPTLWNPVSQQPTQRFVLLAGVNGDGTPWRDVGVYRNGEYVDKYGADSHPTHWMPLPEPPTTRPGTKEGI